MSEPGSEYLAFQPWAGHSQMGLPEEGTMGEAEGTQPDHSLSFFFFLFSFLRRSFILVAQAGMQWHDLGSLQPLSPDSSEAIFLLQPPK